MASQASRSSATGRKQRNKKPKVLDLSKIKHVIPAPQAYVHLYKSKVMPIIMQRYAEYKTNLPEGEKAKSLIEYQTKIAGELLAKEDSEVKAHVELYRQNPEEDCVDAETAAEQTAYKYAQ